MPAAEFDFVLEQGATFDYTLTWVDDTNTAVNLTGYTARMQLRAGPPSNETVALSLTTENGYITLGGVAGTIALLVPASVTNTINSGLHSYDLELVDGITVVRLIRGTIDVVAGVTR